MVLSDSLIYEVFKESIVSEKEEKYESFGIRVINPFGKEVERYGDISLNENTVTSLCEKCNNLKLDPIHLLDVIEDLI